MGDDVDVAYFIHRYDADPMNKMVGELNIDYIEVFVRKLADIFMNLECNVC